MTVSLSCRCGASATHVHWHVIDEAQRPELVDALKSGQLGRAECLRCGRVLFCDEPITVLRTAALTPVRLVFSAKALDERDVPTIEGPLLPWLPLPFEAAAIVLERDLDADMKDAAVACAEVAQGYGHAAGLSYRHWLRLLLAQSDAHGVFEHVGDLADIVVDDFRRLLEAHPEYLSDEAQQSIDRRCGVFPEYAAVLRALGDLMVNARTNVPQALETYRQAMARIEEQFKQASLAVEELEAALDAGRLDEIVERGPGVVRDVKAVGATLPAGRAAELVATALAKTPELDRAGNLEEALRWLSEAVRYSADDETLARRTMLLALAYSERIEGDRRDNIDEAVRLHREAVRVLGDTDPDLLAQILTNLAHALSLCESGDRAGNLTEAYRLCQAALTWRTPERDAVDWAYTQVNLGNIIAGLADLCVPVAGVTAVRRFTFDLVLKRRFLRRAREREARRAFESVLPYASDLPPALLAVAWHNLARLDRVAAERAPTRAQRRRRLVKLRERLVGQLESVQTVGPMARGRALRELAWTDGELGSRSLAIEGYQRALRELRPVLSPDECEDVAITLAPMLSEEGRWGEAAAAYSDAITASVLRLDQRRLVADRQTRSQARGKLPRWAAFAMAKAGDAQRAALTLEEGRTRELRRRLGADDEQLAALRAASPGLHAEYKRALADMARADLADDTDLAAARHQRLLKRIWSVPEMTRFGQSVSWSALVAAAAPHQPLVYVNPTTDGTMLLTISGDGPIRSRFLEVTSMEIARRLILGLGSGKQVRPSYFASTAGDGEGIDIALGFTLGWVGTLLGKPIAEELHAVGARGAALIVSGPLGQFPTHVAPWESATGVHTLADEFDITFAASAIMHATARSRAAASGRRPAMPVLVALGDPRDGERPLPAARAEVDAISKHFNPANVHVAKGGDATERFLRRHASAATHLHLACHASGATFDFRASRLELADSDVPLVDLPRIGPLNSRVAVASACNTAMPDIDRADEAYSIAAILLAVGTASAIASLWPVNDLATAILMTRFYDELFEDTSRLPSQALRRAQVWLRDLPRADAESFIAAHATLAAEASRRREHEHDILPDGDAPFAPPRFWAAFVSMGA
jgi:CHAT domain-containing protein/tetratricopeptide (TPR) repeat protein